MVTFGLIIFWSWQPWGSLSQMSKKSYFPRDISDYNLFRFFTYRQSKSNFLNCQSNPNSIQLKNVFRMKTLILKLDCQWQYNKRHTLQIDNAALNRSTLVLEAYLIFVTITHISDSAFEIDIKLIILFLKWNRFHRKVFCLCSLMLSCQLNVSIAFIHSGFPIITLKGG